MMGRLLSTRLRSAVDEYSRELGAWDYEGVYMRGELHSKVRLIEYMRHSVVFTNVILRSCQMIHCALIAASLEREIVITAIFYLVSRGLLGGKGVEQEEVEDRRANRIH